MFQKYEDRKAMKQLRKDHLAKQKMRFSLIALAIMGAMLVAMSTLETAKPVETAPVVAVANQDIEKFADVITKPLDELSSEDLDFMASKAKDPCYEKNALLPREEMIVAIKACSS